MAHLTGSIGFPHQTSEVTSYSSLTPNKIELGTRSRDAAGNEYIYLDFGSARAKGEIVTWDENFLAAATGATTVGYIGVVCAEAGTSDVAGWVQIYGINTTVLAGSALTSGFLQCGAVTDLYSVPEIAATTGFTYKIIGMNAVTSASTATSPGWASTASSILGVFTARLNYPYVSPDLTAS